MGEENLSRDEMKVFLLDILFDLKRYSKINGKCHSDKSLKLCDQVISKVKNT